MTNEHKEKIKKVMLDHLTETVKYPDCTNKEIFAQLKSMWIKLEEAGLILPGMSYQKYVENALLQDQLQHINNIFGL